MVRRRIEQEEMRRTERTPAQTFLGAFAPMSSPVATAPPGMIERKVLVCGGRTAGTLGGRKKRGVDTKTRDGRRGIHASFIRDGPGTLQDGERGRRPDNDAVGYTLLIISARTISPRGARYKTIHNRLSQPQRRWPWWLTFIMINWRSGQYFPPLCDVSSSSHYNFCVTYSSHLDQYPLRFISLLIWPRRR